ncbi:Omp28-related outer membrane protein [Flavobacterium sp. 20NA77.7]|uniref:Omp28-related outer membrane protein n=1 Tax=Flavobacterium nakdongensis TaxID=3073563 RepID=A0ABY9RAJ4_9FLAO|nr:Omp28-related outer membrane protein [Flavobacterium sp. 20NA77.7]WMW77694.1 Omp28-related outer membrane protein [Flavobacterium sp. 20NA77.7]
MKKLTTSALLLAAILLTSCGGSDDNSGGNGNGGGSTPVTPIAGKFTKNVLIEDFTGTWCGYCPRVAYGIEKVLEQNITAVPVAIHRGNDPYNFAEGSTLESQINLTGYPTAMINRTLDWAYPEPNNTIQVKNQTGPNADLGIAMNSTVANGTINLDVKVKFDANMTGLKLVVYALENNLIYNQTNYTSYYGGVSTIQNFEHDNVLRASLTNILGDAITSNTNDGDIYTRNFTVNVPSNVANASNLSFVAFVIGTDNKAINVRAALPNVNQTFQENQ